MVSGKVKRKGWGGGRVEGPEVSGHTEHERKCLCGHVVWSLWWRWVGGKRCNQHPLKEVFAHNCARTHTHTLTHH